VPDVGLNSRFEIPSMGFGAIGCTGKHSINLIVVVLLLPYGCAHAFRMSCES
jgi:hypothetical protein